MDAPTGGGLPSPGMIPHAQRASKAHTHATRQQCAARGMMHRQHAARRQTQPVCVRNVRLYGNSRQRPAPTRPPRRRTPTQPTRATQDTAPHPHKAPQGTRREKQPARRAKAPHPIRRSANRAFSLFRVLYKYYLYTYAKRKKIKSFPRHIHGVKRLFAARQNMGFPGLLLW